MRKLLNQIEQDNIASAFRDGTPQDELAISYGVSRSTIRRTLHNYGLVVMNTEASPVERDMLDAIKALGIESVERLRQVLRKGVQC